MRTTITAALTAVLLLVVAGPAEAQSGHDLFQQALVKERADGDLGGAIAIYEQIAREFTADRTLAAKALVQLGQCYEKLGSTEAERAYRRVVREFADQDDLVVRAHSRLAALQRAARATEAVVLTTRKVWSGPEAYADGPTPDGKYLVYRDFQGTMDLALREIATGKTRYLTKEAKDLNGTANAYGGRVSPDGKWVAHGFGIYQQGGSLRLVGIDGRNLRVLLEEPGCWIHPHGWTSDSKQILGRWDCWSEAHPEGTHRIVLVSLSDGTVRVVRELPSVRYAYQSWLSPDDRYLVYGGPAEDDDGNGDIWLALLDGGEAERLIGHPADDRLLGWVPGTSRILFLSDRDGSWDLWAARVTDGGVEGSPRKLQRDLGEVNAAGFSENGAFFFSVFTRWFTTVVAPFDPVTGNVDLSAATPLLGSNRSPHWSPDGQYLAFVSEPIPPEGKWGTLNVRNLTTGEQRELATHLRVRFTGGWSPDGRAILATAWDPSLDAPGYAGAIYAIDVPTGEATPLLTLSPTQSVWPEWSADGRGIIYSLRVDRAEVAGGRILRRELASGEERELYRDSLLSTWPVEVSPDGGQLVFAVDDTVGGIGWRGGLGVLDMESGSARSIAVHGDSVGGEEGSAQWTPNGKYIVYGEIVHGDEWHTDVWRVAAEGGAPEYLWTFAEGKYGGWFELSPDGRQIALTTYTQENEIWVMENLREVLGPQQQARR